MVELIDWTTWTWDRHLVETKFHRDDAEAILQIPLSRRYTDDILFWLHNREGKYTVKSGYHIARQIWKEAQSQGECSTGTGVSPVWGKIWKLHIPNKIKVFGWRACQNILPTSENLARRHIVEVARVSCGREQKNLSYMLVGMQHGNGFVGREFEEITKKCECPN